MPQLLVFRGDFPHTKSSSSPAMERALLLLEGYEAQEAPRELLQELFASDVERQRQLQVAVQLLESFLQVERAWARHGEGDLAVAAVLSEAAAPLKTLRAHARLRRSDADVRWHRMRST